MTERCLHQTAGKSTRALILRELKLMKRYLAMLTGLEREQYALDVLYAEAATETTPLGSDQFSLLCKIADGAIEAHRLGETQTRQLKCAGRAWVETARRHDGVTVWCLTDLARWYLDRSVSALRRAHAAFCTPETEPAIVVEVRPLPTTTSSTWAPKWELLLSDGHTSTAVSQAEVNHEVSWRRSARKDYDARRQVEERVAQAQRAHAAALQQFLLENEKR